MLHDRCLWWCKLLGLCSNPLFIFHSVLAEKKKEKGQLKLEKSETVLQSYFSSISFQCEMKPLLKTKALNRNSLNTIIYTLKTFLEHYSDNFIWREVRFCLTSYCTNFMPYQSFGNRWNTDWTICMHQVCACFLSWERNMPYLYLYLQAFLLINSFHLWSLTNSSFPIG